MYYNLTTIFVVVYTEIDECATGQHNCGPNAQCVNSEGSYTCQCRHGYTGDSNNCTRKSYSYLELCMDSDP